MMPDTTQNQESTNGRLEFIQYHLPALKSGQYTIKVEQRAESAGRINGNGLFSTEKRFAVLGQRFSIKPDEIQAVFPPDGSRGDHTNVLPHIILGRSTLPWERDTGPGRNDVPWLALLLFDEAEAPSPQITTVGDLRGTRAAAPKFPTLPEEVGHDPSEKVTVIDVPYSTLAPLLPTADDLALLAHVRQPKNAQGNLQGDELAVIIGNRLPQAGQTSTAHLVSVELRYGTDGQFDSQGANPDDLIRLVSLKSWQFYCPPPGQGLLKQSFTVLLENLDRNPAYLRVPPTGQGIAARYLASGNVAAPHFMRQGDKTVSWYHGPLLPGQNPMSADVNFPAPPYHTSDELLIYHQEDGMFGVSYAAAWELGRLLALQSNAVAVSLYQWKRACFQQMCRTEQAALHPHLPQYKRVGDPTPPAALPDSVSQWFHNLALLQGMPFNYLVPDERMLPPESIRFFYLDPLWITCLLNGAFSIGRVTQGDMKQDIMPWPATMPNPHRQVTGLLLRSEVVAGWPGLQIDGYDLVANSTDFVLDQDNLTLLRLDRLSQNVLIALFAGELKTVDIHQKPEMLHFGFDRPDEIYPDFFKRLRDLAGREEDKTVDELSWKDDDRARRVIDMADFAQKIGTAIGNSDPLTSATFGLEMIEGVEKVRFAKSGS